MLKQTSRPSVGLSVQRAPTLPCRINRRPLAPCRQRSIARVAAEPSGPSPKIAEVSPEPEPRVFVDRDGNKIQVLAVDYGFRSGAGRLYEEHYGEVPSNAWELAKANFRTEWRAMRQHFRFNDLGQRLQESPPKGWLKKARGYSRLALITSVAKLDAALERSGALAKLEEPPRQQTPEWVEVKSKLSQLTLDNAAVIHREHARVAKDGELDTPWVVKAAFWALCWVMDLMYEGKPIQKFWVLETVARIPYFAYISILHLYESLGLWRAGAELRKVHFAEEWNEMHHLQIMESLGGDQSWFDRFFAQNAAILYYWVLIGFYVVSPKAAYNFMERVELHAFDTYAEFVVENEELLKTIPPPMVSCNYYLTQDLYLFDEFQTGRKGNPRRPPCRNLLDVFRNIRDDEQEHVKTMAACQQDSIAKQLAAKRGQPMK